MDLEEGKEWSIYVLVVWDEGLFCWIKQFDWLSIEQVSEMPIPEVLKVGDFFFYLITTPCNIVNIG